MNNPLGRKYLAILLVLLLGGINILSQEPVFYVTISTNMGNMKVKLYNETPNHRDNFLKLAGEKHFDGTLFYRVVKGFVIQGGSSDSRNAAPGRAIGYGKAINIDSEFDDECFHKKGAICAPRQPEDVNHFKMSDISQFYIVQGRKYTNEELDLIEKATNNPIKIELKKQFYVPHKEELARLKTEDPKAFNKLLREIKDKIAFHYSISNKKEFTEEQRQAYTTIGGTPELDGEYTVFGEVVEGLDVIRKIAAMDVDKANRPYTDVKIKVTVEKL
ncbi:peptidylprolyl isomerase [Carboxylicivirga linearis]|uniref:peptidylprolyl isomerase n=1 Tax=Carboxylicivirga linearis TaxID=1628157 RepID=A0ABS5JQ15_9BACT|nr:peptidylprolyl isomerase [Carboxylicivirga linearis]MBS2096974.1 peptidylprolyl isomerase [Carboxylicivirga linearis]